MKFIRDLSRNYAFDPQHYWFLNPVEDCDVNVYFGYQCNKNQCNQNNSNVYIDIEMPNFTFLRFNEYYDMFQNYDYIFGICPWTCKMLNQLLNTDKFIYTKLFIPNIEIPIIERKNIAERNSEEENIEERNSEGKKEREISIIYTGSNIPLARLYFIVMKEINGKTKTKEIVRALEVKKKETYIEKLKLLNKSKIAIVHNVLGSSNLPNKHNFPHLSQFYPFFNETEFPQAKTRILEASLMGCVMLCKKDKYNLIEEYFVENEDFIYFTDENDLREKIHMILNDYEKYRYLAINAQKKCLENHTEERFINDLKTLLSKREREKREEINEEE